MRIGIVVAAVEHGVAAAAVGTTLLAPLAGLVAAAVGTTLLAPLAGLVAGLELLVADEAILVVVSNTLPSIKHEIS